ncbi:MAG: hypothetical protein NTW59_02455, partial [Candidatus Diapherotrites archaeon]|nr:hypothetical protein [Candidatus Diapherotrites archaeon]
MPEKKAIEKEKEAWDDYVKAIEGMEAEKNREKKKKGPLGGTSSFLGKIKIWQKKEQKAAGVEAPLLSDLTREAFKPTQAEENLATPEEKARLKWAFSGETEKKPQVPKKWAFGRKEEAIVEEETAVAEQKQFEQPTAGQPEEKPQAAEKEAEMPKATEAEEPLVIPKKVAEMPAPGPAKKETPSTKKKTVEQPRITAPAKALQPKEAPAQKTAAAKKAGAKKAAGAKEKAAAGKIAKKTAAKAKKPAKEKTTPAIKRIVRIVKIAKKSGGWYGDRLRHRKAAFSSWLLQKKIKLYELRKKGKRKKPGPAQLKLMKKLDGEKEELNRKILQVDERITMLRNVGRKIKFEEKQLVRKVREAGIKLPRKEMQPLENGRVNLRSEDNVHDAIDAVKAVAEEMAAAISRMPVGPMQPGEELGIDDQVTAMEKLMKGLELAFYKRKI